jgi:agmatine deiminase
MLPAWGPHARTWMAWPCRREIWRDGMEPARRAYAEVAKAIAQFEPVVMAARPEDTAEAQRLLGAGIAVWPVALDDSWARDIAPVFIAKKGEPAGVYWNFNAWGNKYQGYAADAAFGLKLLQRQELRAFQGGMVLEGGAVAVNERGTLMATEECLLNPNRNPALQRAEVEAGLKANLGITHVLWLGQGLVGDETDGHVDNVACFAEGGRVLLAMPRDRHDPSGPAMRENAARLRAARDAEGRGFTPIDVPLPKLRLDAGGRPLTRSYINFALANGGLVVPAFDDPADDVAAKIIADVFPHRRVVQVDANPIVIGGGGIHCITYEEPAVP